MAKGNENINASEIDAIIDILAEFDDRLSQTTNALKNINAIFNILKPKTNNNSSLIDFDKLNEIIEALEKLGTDSSAKLSKTKGNLVRFHKKQGKWEAKELFIKRKNNMDLFTGRDLRVGDIVGVLNNKTKKCYDYEVVKVASINMIDVKNVASQKVVRIDAKRIASVNGITKLNKLKQVHIR